MVEQAAPPLVYVADPRRGAPSRSTHIAETGRLHALCGKDTRYSQAVERPPAGYQVCRSCRRLAELEDGRTP